MELAKSGELQAVAIAGVLDDDNTLWNWHFGQTAPTIPLIGAIGALAKEVTDDALNEHDHQAEEGEAEE